jgi:pimeloyl-ACP methyl ester carboxylesterase
MDLDAATRTVTVGGLAFPVVDHGRGPAVLLLHGFPDSRHMWRHQLPALAEAGFRAIAPDLRGFGEAPAPPEVEAYRYDALVADVIGILDALGVERTSLVGHDWGAALAWKLVAVHPERFDRLVAISVGAPGNPGSFTIEQREKSWYYDYFLKVGKAEEGLRKGDWKLFREWSRGQGDEARHLRDLARPGRLTAGLSWYRANLGPQPPGARASRPEKVRVPVLGIWGERDPFLLEPQMTGSQAFVAGPWRYERMRDAGHWLMLDQPAELNRLLLDFLPR